MSRRITEMTPKLGALTGRELIPIVDRDVNGEVLPDANKYIETQRFFGSDGTLAVCTQTAFDSLFTNGVEGTDFNVSALASPNTVEVIDNTVRIFGDGVDSGSALITFNNVRRAQITFSNIVIPVSEELQGSYSGYTIGNSEVFWFTEGEETTITLTYPTTLNIFTGDVLLSNVLVTINVSEIGESCEAPVSTLLFPVDSGLIVTPQTDPQTSAFTGEMEFKTAFDGSFSQRGNTENVEGGEGDTSFDIDLDLVRIARNIPLPNPTGFDTQFNINFVLNVQGGGSVLSASGNLIMAPYSNVFTIINQTSLEVIPPTQVGFVSADPNSIFIENVNYDGSIIRITFRANNPDLMPNYSISGTIAWDGTPGSFE